MLLFEYPQIRRGLRKLAAVKGDRRATLSLLADSRAADEPADVQAAIVRELGNHAGGEVLDALEEVLRDAPHWRVRAAATVALGALHDQRARELLRATAEQDSHGRVRENAKFNLENPGAFAPH